MKDQDVITQQLKQKYVDFYICIITKCSNFTEAKIIKDKVREFHAFIWMYYISTEVQQKLAVLTAPPYTLEHNLCQGVPVPHAVSASQAAHVTPAEMPTGSLPLYPCSVVPKTGHHSEPLTEMWLLTLRSPCSSRWLDVAQLGLRLTVHLFYRKSRASLKGWLRYTHSDQTWNQNYPHPSLQYQCLKCILLCFARKKIWGNSCVLSPFFCYSSDTLCKEL